MSTPHVSATFNNIKKVRDGLAARYDSTNKRVYDHLQAKVEQAGGEEGLTDHEKDVLELCRTAEIVSTVEILFAQIQSKGEGGRLKLTYEQLAMWEKVLEVRVEEGPEGEAEFEVEDEEYRVETPDGTPHASPSTRRKRRAPKSDIHILIASKRPRSDPRAPFKHVSNALREEIVRDHITSERGQLATVAKWKERYPDLSITQSSLSRWIKNAEGIQLANASNLGNSGRSHTKVRLKNPDVDEETATIVLDMQDQGEKITSDLIKRKYQEVCERHGATGTPRLSATWMEGFKKRHGLDFELVKSEFSSRKSARDESSGQMDDSTLAEAGAGQRNGADGQSRFGTLDEVMTTAMDGDNRDMMGYLAVSAAAAAAAAAAENENENDPHHPSSAGHAGQPGGVQGIQDGRESHLRQNHGVDEGIGYVEEDIGHGDHQGLSTLHEAIDAEANSLAMGNGMGVGVVGMGNGMASLGEDEVAQRLIREVFEREQQHVGANGEGGRGVSGDAREEEYMVDPALS